MTVTRRVDFPDGTHLTVSTQAGSVCPAFEMFGDDDEMELSGFVKFGCLNWSTSEDCMYHTCDEAQELELVRRFQIVRALAAELGDDQG